MNLFLTCMCECCLFQGGPPCESFNTAFVYSGGLSADSLRTSGSSAAAALYRGIPGTSGGPHTPRRHDYGQGVCAYTGAVTTYGNVTRQPGCRPSIPIFGIQSIMHRDIHTCACGHDAFMNVSNVELNPLRCKLTQSGIAAATCVKHGDVLQRCEC